MPFYSTHLPVAVAALILGSSAAATTLVQPVPVEPAPLAPSNAAPQSGMPNACRLLVKSDFDALFPGQQAVERGRSLSPLSRGAQYVESCNYAIRLPSPTSTGTLVRFATIAVIRWDHTGTVRSDAATAFAHLRQTRQQIALDPKLKMQIEALPDVGADAYLETTEQRTTITARSGDLVYSVSLDNYSPQTRPNAVALAKQAASRWVPGLGMVEAPTAIAANKSVDIPADTRVSATARAELWPDACELLRKDDVLAVFADMKISGPRAARGQIRHETRDQRVEDLPKPIGCTYEARQASQTGGQRQTVTYQVQASVRNLASTPEASQRFYDISQKVGEPKTVVGGLGDQASIDVLNRLQIRKGLLTVELRVGGGERDPAVHADAKLRLMELAKRVEPRLR